MQDEREKTLPTRSEWDELFPQIRLSVFLKQRFSRLSVQDCEDLAQDVYVAVSRRIERGEPFLTCTLEAFAYWLAKNRALDVIRRRREAKLFAQSADGEDDRIYEPADPFSATPSRQAMEKERQERKGITFAAIIEEFCHHCERDIRRRVWKQVLERTMKGESIDQITTEMGFQNEAAALQVFHRAFDVLVPIIQQHDPDHSMLKTLVWILGIDKTSGNRRPGKLQPYVNNDQELRRYLTEESAAFCPLAERLASFRDNPIDPQVADVSYHVATGCQHCRLELDTMATSAGVGS